jgi:hypothetical protein
MRRFLRHPPKTLVHFRRCALPAIPVESGKAYAPVFATGAVAEKQVAP